ncbi:MAG: glycosyltransferase family A protein [Lachnospiraceae bacterium]
MFTGEDHTFIICAYEESRYLEDCVKSLMEQRVKSNILMSTSTPNEFIRQIACKYNIPICIRTGKGNIAEDWNFAYAQVKTQLVTIAHQDDIYCNNYLEEVLKHINQAKRPLIIFGNYGEIRKNKLVRNNRLLKIKEIMLFPLRNKVLWPNRFVRRRILSLGSAICCPSVTFVKENLPSVLFEKGYQSNLDWQAWEKISRLDGSFVYCSKLIMYHRIHEESATTQIIADRNRTKEDYEMYCRFWPSWIARCLTSLYEKSQDSNYIEN